MLLKGITKDFHGIELFSSIYTLNGIKACS